MNTRAEQSWGKEPHRLLSLDEAHERISAEVTPLASRAVALDQAVGRVLASPIVASEDNPAFHKAMMDGFAVRAADCTRPSTELEILGLAPAGAEPTQTVGKGQAVQINTGAPVPDGADAVVRIEDTTRSADGAHVTVNAPISTGKHIAPRASNTLKGDVVLAPPLRLESAQIAAAATAGAAEVEVYPEVSVAIAVTGNELVAVGQAKKPGQIFESNGPMLAALMRQFGARPEQIGIVPDEPQALKHSLAAAMQHPLVIAVGGMSMGTLDLVPQVFADLGVDWKFHGVRMRPGKPVAYGRGPDGQHVFGLPGNPVSAFVCAWLFVRMVIRGLQGLPPSPPQRWSVTLAADLKPGRDSRIALLPARVWNCPDRGMMAEPCAWHGSGDPVGLAKANALLVREKPTDAAPAGHRAEVILISSDI